MFYYVASYYWMGENPSSWSLDSDFRLVNFTQAMYLAFTGASLMNLAVIFFCSKYFAFFCILFFVASFLFAYKLISRHYRRRYHLVMRLVKLKNKYNPLYSSFYFAIYVMPLLAILVVPVVWSAFLVKKTVDSCNCGRDYIENSVDYFLSYFNF
jgi:hypothetical protein